MSKEDDELTGLHTCGRCKSIFPAHEFHVGAGFCDDCYGITHDELNDPDDLNWDEEDSDKYPDSDDPADYEP